MIGTVVYRGYAWLNALDIGIVVDDKKQSHGQYYMVKWLTSAIEQQVSSDFIKKFDISTKNKIQ